MLSLPSRTDATGTSRCYVRFAALGDSVTYGIGDPATDGCRGWARLLADAMGLQHDVSFFNVARPGATIRDVQQNQLASALAHRPHLASLIVGVNDTLRSSWDAEDLRSALLDCAEQLTSEGALLLTARFHDHSRVLRLPFVLARPMQKRIRALNAMYDEVHDRFGGIRLDLAAHPGSYDGEFWSIDRLHPSELGHRALADEYAALLADLGLEFPAPGLTLNGLRSARLDEIRWLLREGVPWLGRRARDLTPALIGMGRKRTADVVGQLGRY